MSEFDFEFANVFEDFMQISFRGKESIGSIVKAEMINTGLCSIHIGFVTTSVGNMNNLMNEYVHFRVEATVSHLPSAASNKNDWAACVYHKYVKTINPVDTIRIETVLFVIVKHE